MLQWKLHHHYRPSAILLHVESILKFNGGNLTMWKRNSNELSFSLSLENKCCGRVCACMYAFVKPKPKRKYKNESHNFKINLYITLHCVQSIQIS